MAHRKSLPFSQLFDSPLRTGVTKPKAVRGHGVKMVSMGELFEHARLGSLEMERVPLDATERRSSLLRAGDLLFARQSLMLAGAGKCCLFQGDAQEVTFESHIIRCRLDPTKAAPAFYFYLFQSPHGRALIESIVEQVAAAGIRSSDLGRLEVPVPPLAEQRAIAAILTNLDDMIDLNRRMNATLESLLRALFQRFFVDSESLRKDFRMGHLGDVSENPRRSVRPEKLDPKTPYIGLDHMPRRCIALSAWGQAAELESHKFAFRRDELLFGKLRPYFHKVGIAPLDGICSTDILVVAPKSPAWFGFVLGHLCSSEFIRYTDAASEGTKMPRTSWRDMARYAVALPTESLAAQFTERVRPAIDRILKNVHASRTLTTLRDTLLPKLLSGELHPQGARRSPFRTGDSDGINA